MNNELVGVIKSESLSITVQITESGPRGPQGKDGHTPIKGIDYFDGKDGTNGINGKDGVDGIQGTNGADGVNGKDGLTTAVKLGTTQYTHVNGVVSLPSYPTTLPANGGNSTTVNGHTVYSDVPSNAKFTDTIYEHPPSHPATMIVEDANNRFVTDAEKAVWNNPPASSGKRVCRFVVGTSAAGWTSTDCDYLCDGTADDVEINDAITALPATGGEVVILDGTYNITAKIDVTKDNVSIRGNGNATILKRMFDSGTAEGVITLIRRSGCKIANLQIEGNKTIYTNNNNSGIYLSASNNNTVTGNTCNNNKNSGIYSSISSNNTVTGNTCNNNNYESGIYLMSSSNNTVTGNTCNNNKYSGICLSASSNNTVTGNTCNNNNYESGIYLSASNNNTVTGNTCNNNNLGIRLDSSNNNTVTGNTCNNNNHGIRLDSSSNNTVTGNTCNNNNLGIRLDSSNNNTVTGNTCIRGTGLETDYTVSQHTIQLMGTGNKYNLISSNNCMGKAVTNEGGTGNTLVNNKFDAT